MCGVRDSIYIYERRYCLRTEHVLQVHRQPWQGGQTEWPIIGTVLRDYQYRSSRLSVPFFAIIGSVIRQGGETEWQFALN